MTYTLRAISYHRLRFTLRALRGARLAPFHGSLLRGAFGHALRAVSCTPALTLPGPAMDRVTLRFSTALRLMTKGRLAPVERFRDLAFAMLRRVLELAHFHAPDAPIDWSFRPLLDRAADVRIAGSTLAFEDWARYSQRQERPVQMGGYVGRLTLEGDLAPFAPLLRAAELFHFGKGAVMGLGRFTIEA
jgi:hypothetical protein